MCCRTSVWFQHQPLTLNLQMWCQLCCFEVPVLPCIWQYIWNQDGGETGPSKSICNNSTVLHRFILFLLKHVLLPHSSAKARGGYILSIQHASVSRVSKKIRTNLAWLRTNTNSFHIYLQMNLEGNLQHLPPLGHCLWMTELLLRSFTKIESEDGIQFWCRQQQKSDIQHLGKEGSVQK